MNLKIFFQGLSVSYITSSITTPIIGLCANLLTIGFLKPKEIGIIQGFLLIVTYFNLLQLGVFNSLNRDLAIHKARNEIDIINDKVNTAYVKASFLAMAGLFFSIYLIIEIETSELIQILSIIFLALNLIITPYKIFFESVFRSFGKFSELGKMILKENLVYGTFSLIQIPFGYVGKFIAEYTKLIFSFFIRWRFRIVPLKYTFKFQTYIELIKTGFPILLGSYIWSVFLIMDQTIISLKLGTLELGLYSLSRMTNTTILVIPMAINAMMYEKICSNLGEKHFQKTQIIGLMKKTLMLNMITIIPIVILGYVIIPLLTPIIFPSYQEGLTALKINLIGSLSFILTSSSLVYSAINKNKLYILLVSAFTGLFYLIYFLFENTFDSIEGIALLRAIILFAMGITLCLNSFLTIKKYSNE